MSALSPSLPQVARHAAPLRKAKPAPCSYVHDLTTPMIELSRRDWLLSGHLFEGTMILGATGSGKSSASAAHLARAMLAGGWGGLVLCAKPGEADQWQRYARETGREQSLIRFDASGKWTWDFLAYEISRWPAGEAVIFNVVSLLVTVLKAINGETGQAPHGSEAFFQKAVREALTHAVGIVYAAYGTLDLSSVMAVLQSPPPKPGVIDEPAWQQGAMGQALMRAFDTPAVPMPEADFWAAHEYLTRTLANPDPRTVGNIIASVSADLAPLRQGLLRKLMGSGQTNILPELSHEGAVIVIDLPLKQWEETGRLAAHIWKYCWQRAAERRQVTAQTRPLFLFVDEAQFFISPYDAEFLSTARSAKVATTFITQSLPALYEKMGGRNPHDATDALLGNFQTKIFHANGDTKTNQYASELIGKGLQLRRSAGDNVGRSYSENAGSNSGSSHDGQRATHSHGTSSGRSGGLSSGENQSYAEQMDYIIQPNHFTGLRKGGQVNRGRVEAVLFQGGRRWEHSGAAWLQVEFRQ